MSLFDQFPYTNFHELNLDWLLRSMKELSNVVENFVALNTIKYADPIQWDITTQYEANTVVINPLDGTAYLSSQPVPSGVAITNTDYWRVIFTLDVLSANKNITLRDDGSNILSTFSSVAGDWILWNGILYKATQAINVNEAYVIGYNIERYTVELFIRDYIADIITKIGDLADLNTSDKTSIVNAVNELVLSCATITANIGDLANLNTTDKTSIVNAVNELVLSCATITANIGDLANLNTTDKTSIVNAVNELVSYSDNNKIYNVLNYGATGDGVTDDTASIQLAINDVNTTGGIIYFPRGRYLISDTLLFTHHATTVRGGGQQATFILQSVTKPAIQMGDGNGLKIAMRVEDIAVSSRSGFTTQNTNTIGIYFNECVNSTCNNTVVGDMICGYQLTHTGNSFLTECGYSSNLHNSVGFNIGDRSVSTKVSSCYAGFMTDAVDDGIGLIMNRGDIADICIEYFDVGNGYTTIEIDGSNSPADLPPADIRLHDIVSDGARKYAIDIKNINAQGNVIIDGGWINPYRSNTTACININNANNITITNIKMQQLLDDTPAPVGIAGSSNSFIKISNCDFINLYSPISISGIDYCTIINNSIRLYAGKSSLAYALALIGCYHSIISENEIYGSYSAGDIYLDNTGDYSIVKNNITNGNITDSHNTKVVSDNI